jgi:ribonuclease G
VEALRHPPVYILEEQHSLEEDEPSFAVREELVRQESDREEIDQRLASQVVVEFPGEIPGEEGLSAAELAEEEILAERTADGEDFEGADLEDAGVASPESGGEGSPEAKGQGTSSDQGTSTGRDPNGPYPHRSSRRMRRRRGGNRFSNASGENSPTMHAGSGVSGAAMAIQPDVRNEPPREVAEERSPERPERVMPSITELLKPGQEIIVQIAKEPLGQKGARITSHIALPGRYVVFMPSVNHLGVSRKIASDEERQRLKRALQAHRPGPTGGFIVRTAGEGIPDSEIAADMDFLYKLWVDIRQKAEKKPAPALLHYDLDIVQRILRDQVTEDFKAIWVDSEEMYEHVLSFTQRFQPALVSRVKMYTRSAPIFDAFGITQELEKALRPKVWLKSGGYIVINQTEALVAIDINTGKYVGKSNRLEDTIVKTNIEAVKEIVRQIRLRDLGGIIVVDFIDMDERKNRQRVMQALEEAMEADKAPYKILQFNDFGLVAITRKRVKQSLERTLCAPCPYCEGAGYVKSVQTIISEILVEAQKIAKAIEGKDVLLRVHPDVAKVLKANDNKYLEELEEILGRPVLVKSDPALHHEKFDLG